MVCCEDAEKFRIVARQTALGGQVDLDPLVSEPCGGEFNRAHGVKWACRLVEQEVGLTHGLYAALWARLGRWHGRGRHLEAAARAGEPLTSCDCSGTKWAAWGRKIWAETPAKHFSDHGTVHERRGSRQCHC